MLLRDERMKKDSDGLPGNKLTVSRGRLYMYRLVVDKDVHGSEQKKVIDCGFDIYIDRPPGTNENSGNGYPVESTKTPDGCYKLSIVTRL